VNRIAALLAKEFVDLRQNPGVFVPALLVGLSTATVPFMVAILIPALTGERLSDSSDFQIALEVWGPSPPCVTSRPKAPCRRGSSSSS